VSSLGEIEKSMIDVAINRISTEDELTGVQKADLISKIRSLTRTKIRLLKEVSNRNNFIHDNIKYDVTSLAEQANAVEIIERELIRIEKELEALRQEKINKKRNTDLNIYYSKAYIDHVKLMKIVIFIILCLISFRLITRLYPVPSIVSSIVWGLIIGGGLILVISKILNIRLRDNNDYDKYYWGDYNVKNDSSKNNGKKSNLNGKIFGGIGSSCVGSFCCNPETTVWNPETYKCDTK
jgi:hypothetical protein